MAIKGIEYQWQDKKRWLGMPLTFTHYRLSEDRFFVETGFFNKRFDEVLLYRVRDISLKRSLWQRMFGVGTIVLYASDATTPSLEIRNVKNSEQVKEMIYHNVEDSKQKHRVRINEFMDAPFADENGDGRPD